MPMRAANEQLENANHELEAFAYSISHDLRAPLHSIAGLTQRVLSEYDQQMPPESVRFLQLVYQNAENMDALVNGLLSLSRTSRQPLKKETVAPGQLVDKCSPIGVFQRFHPQEDYKGTGVGLAIVARIVDRHGGRIRAESKEDQDAAFYFTR